MSHREDRRLDGKAALKQLLGVNKRLNTAYLMKENFSQLWDYRREAWARRSFQLLKRERIRRRIYTTRNEARSDVFHHIEMFYNARRQHGHNGGLPPVEFEKRQSV